MGGMNTPRKDVAQNDAMYLCTMADHCPKAKFANGRYRCNHSYFHKWIYDTCKNPDCLLMKYSGLAPCQCVRVDPKEKGIDKR